MPTTSSGAPGLVDVLAAARRLEQVARRTPLERSAALSRHNGTDVYLKLENQQRTGAFKFRGAYNAVISSPADQQANGLVTASAGNHGLGLALAAQLCGVAVTVFVPATAPRIKRDRIARLGATVREVAGSYDEAHVAAEEFSSTSGARYVHAFSDPAVVAGQGTVGLEIFQDLPRVRTLVVPVGGGGLIGGVGVVARSIDPCVRVVGAQSTATSAMHASLAAASVVSPAMGPTLCDGLAGDVDAHSLALAQHVVDRIVLVEEKAVREAIRWLYVEEGVVAEGSAATVVAALLGSLVPPAEGPIAAVLSGGNIDAALLAQILS